MKIDDSLSEVFDTPLITKTEGEVIDATTGEIVVTGEHKIEDDYDVARNNLRELLTTGQEALMQALEVAKQSEHPRAFEVVGNLMKNLSDINHQLLDLHTKRQELKEIQTAPKNGKGAPPSVTNNSIFVGSTAELSKMIENMRKDQV